MSDEREQILVEEQDLIILHKKERKELQARIQILKKSVCKGDKKKKKEITEEIVRLETDLDKKQDEEIARFKLSQMNIDKTTCVKVEDQITNGDSESSHYKNNQDSKSTVKVSKAQKRREKKEIAEKERNQKIIEQEALNVYGKRNVEAQAINNILSKRDLMIYEIPSDGHCLYNAVAHQLKLIGNTPSLNFIDLRKQTAKYLREHSDNFLSFIDNPDSDDIMSIEQYEKYCDSVGETSAWGGAVELQVLANVLQCPIEVIQASGVPYIVGEEYEQTRKLILTYHRHMYQLGAHYNSVTKYIANLEDS
ncbi:deubiquitinase OTUD6B-like [Phymastichus coffea]|uniref:deubiquitinase OTUD6B-like n=1 Tax=Phymastichus coffea TaxID=108790 RepID=UPI00273BDCBA|nr:deubiquitinase OTUD6B-like [Phymastichus coffea]